MTDTPPDRLSTHPDSPFYDAEVLNGSAALLLLIGYAFIRNGLARAHGITMLAAFLVVAVLAGAALRAGSFLVAVLVAAFATRSSFQ